MERALFATVLAGMIAVVTPGLAQVRLVRAMMTRSVPANACTPTPSPVETFLTTDPSAFLWFEVQGAAAGDVAASEWWAPGARLLTKPGGEWPRLEDPGSYCFSERLAIAGNPQAVPGNWTVRILWNGKPLGAVNFTITAAPACTYTLSATSFSAAAAGGTGSVNVTAPAGCSWKAASNAAWLTITSGASGSGSGTVQFTVAANTATTSRTGTLTIAGQTFTVTQAGAAPACTYNLSATSFSAAAAGGTGSVNVTAPAGCSWKAASNAAWVTITSGASGSGNGTVQFTVAANTATTSRTGTLNIAGQTFTVTQAGAAPAGNRPTITPGGVLNGADYTAEIAPGMMVSIFGQNLAPRTVTAQSVPLPQELEGVSVEVTEPGKAAVRAPLYFVSPGQINIQMPFGLTASAVEVRVRTAAGTSDPARILIVPRAPRLFTRTLDGKGEVIALHVPDYRLVGEGTPVEQGGYLILYATGLGEVRPPATAGNPGGDGARWGPLNEVTEPVRVTVGGKPATVLFAGLAPGLAGVYQINLQLAQDVPVGRQPVVVSIGQRSSQANVWVAVGIRRDPAEVVKAALQAQVRGDLAGMLALYDMERVGEEGRRRSMDVLQTVARHASFSNFSFTHLATGYGNQGTLAVVRAIVSFDITTREGTRPMRHGLMALLKRVAGGWRLHSINPDDLLNMEIAEAEFGRTAGPSSRSQVPLAQKRWTVQEPLDLHELNQRINEALKVTYLDETQLTVEVAFAGAGQLPVYGDAIAIAYQVLDTLGEGYGALKEAVRHGMSGVFCAKAAQVALGVVQIAAELLPGVDAAADMAAGAMDQYAYNLEVARALNQLKLYMRGAAPGAQLNPRMYPVPGFKYDGLLFTMDESVQHSYGAPLASVWLVHPSSLDRQVPFRIIGELPITKNLEIYDYLSEVEKPLGIQERDGLYYLPLDISAWAEEDVSEGDSVLDAYGRYRRKDSVSRVVSWVATCRRGVQILKVRLRNGEIALGPRVENHYMNQIEKLVVGRLPTVYPGVTLLVGGTEEGLRVYGASRSLAMESWPNLTGRRECLDMAISNTSVARLDRGATSLAVTGLAPGTTTLKLLLGGSAVVPGLGDIVEEIPVRVSAGFSWSKIEHKLYGKFLKGGGSMIGTFYTKGPLTWSGNKFSLQVLDYDLLPPGDPPFEVTITGTLSPDGMKMVELNYRRYRLRTRNYRGSDGREYFTYDERLDEWTVTDVPLVSDPKDMLQGKFSRYEVRGPAAAAHLRSYTEIDKFWSGLAEKFSPELLQTETDTISFSAPTDGISIEFFQ